MPALLCPQLAAWPGEQFVNGALPKIPNISGPQTLRLQRGAALHERDKAPGLSLGLTVTDRISIFLVKTHLDSHRLG
jgi:hypothetical protein